jgi:hypothetical protein
VVIVHVRWNALFSKCLLRLRLPPDICAFGKLTTGCFRQWSEPNQIPGNFELPFPDIDLRDGPAIALDFHVSRPE